MGGHVISFQIKPWVAFGLPYLLIELFYIGMPVVRTDGRSVGRCTVTWLPNFLGWVDYHISLVMRGAPLWTHVSRYGINWLYCYWVYKVLTVLMYSSQLLNYQLYFHILLHSSIDWFLPLTPRGCATASVGEYVPNFFHWVFGFSYQAAHVNSLTWVTLFRNICIPFLVMMLNFVCYLDGIKHSGSTVRAVNPFPSLSREYK